MYSLFLALALSSIPVDQPRTYTVRNIEGNLTDVTFPWLTEGNPHVVRRANLLVHAGELGVLPRADGKQGEIKVDYNLIEMKSDGVHSLNQGRMFAVHVSSESCGAYCSASVAEYHFDSVNGDLIEAQDLLLPHAQKTMAPIVLKDHERLLERFMVQVRKELKKPSWGGLTREDLETQLDMYSRCLDNIGEYYGDKAGSVHFIDGGVIFSHGECGYHAVRALDDLGSYSFPVKGAKLRPLLTPYGRHLILGEARPKQLPPAAAQVLVGKIGSAASTLILWREYASYFYDKYGVAIPLKMQRQDGKLELIEVGDADKPMATMLLTPANGGWEGSWIGGGKRLPVSFKPSL
jgi:hypothetical protein